MEEAPRQSGKLSFFVTRGLSIDPRAYVPNDIEVRVYSGDGPPSRDALLAQAHGCHTLLTLVSDRVDGILLDTLPSVCHIAQVAVGYDNIEVEACRARGVRVTHTPDVLTDATADLTWGLILAVARRFREGERMVRQGQFHGWSPTMLLGLEMSGCTLGIWGMGRIGSAVARRAQAFGMKVCYASRREMVGAPGERVPFDALLARSDVLSLHVPLDADTRGRIDGPTLARMKPGAILINTSRGPLVDEAALVAALGSGHLGGAGLDVYEHEPAVHPGLLAREDVVLLPHIGSATRAARARMAKTALEDAVRVARGQAPLHPIPELRAAPQPPSDSE